MAPSTSWDHWASTEADCKHLTSQWAEKSAFTNWP